MEESDSGIKLRKKIVFPLIGLALLIVGMQLGATLIQQRQGLRSKAAEPVTQTVPETSFSLQSSSVPVALGQEVRVAVLVRSDLDTANLFSAKLKFPSDLLQVSRVDVKSDTSFVKNWVENIYDNQAGTVSLVGGVPSPGFKTPMGTDKSLMAEVVFVGKKLGTATISFDDTSFIYRNSDNSNILSIKREDSLNISNVAPVAEVAGEFGFNARGIVHYGYKEVLNYSNFSDVDADFGEMKKMGATVVRVFLAHRSVSDEETSKRLDALLTKAAGYNISLIISFIDFYGSGFNPQGTDQYYTGNWNGIPLLNHTFFESGYRDRYLTFVKTIVAANKNHPNIYAWEPGNELKDDSSPQTFVNFMKDVTDTIKSIDPNHKVASGMIYSGHSGLSPDQLYAVLPSLDIITVHSYNGDRSGSVDVDWALSHNKIAIVEEFGVSGTSDRSSKVQAELDFWKSKKAVAVLQWGFLAKGLGDNGDGDKDLGMDNIWHTDYDNLAATFKTFAPVSIIATPTAIKSEPTPTPTLAPAKIKGDANGDGKINLTDLSALMTKYNGASTTSPELDFNNDGLINTLDFSAMLKLLVSNGTIHATL